MASMGSRRMTMQVDIQDLAGVKRLPPGHDGARRGTTRRYHPRDYAGGYTQTVLRSHAVGRDRLSSGHKGANIMYYGGAGGLILLILLILVLTGRL